MTPKKLKTNKLFYGKWPYKITTEVIGGNLIKTRGITAVKQVCQQSGDIWPSRYRKNVDKKKLFEYASLIEPFIEDEIRLRAEHNTINIYVKNVKLYDSLVNSLKDFVVSVTEPVNESELSALLSNNKFVLCDELPKKTFKYKVVLKSMPVSVKESLLKWADQYPDDKIIIPDHTRRELTAVKSWGTNCYMYVSDSSMLMMVTLATQGYIRRTEEFVVRSSINTSI